MLDGHINAKGKAVGGHDRNSPNVRVIQQWVHPTSGLDVAKIQIFDPTSSSWVSKAIDTTLFPADWSPERTLRETSSAFSRSYFDAALGRWIGVSDSGVEISGYYRNVGSPGPGWSTAFPTKAAPS